MNIANYFISLDEYQYQKRNIRYANSNNTLFCTHWNRCGNQWKCRHKRTEIGPRGKKIKNSVL